MHACISGCSVWKSCCSRFGTQYVDNKEHCLITSMYIGTRLAIPPYLWVVYDRQALCRDEGEQEQNDGHHDAHSIRPVVILSPAHLGLSPIPEICGSGG